MPYENITLERKDGVAYLTFNRPKVLNALNSKTMSELSEAVEEIAADSSVVVAIVTGAGEKSFIAGADIAEINKHDPDSGKAMAESGQAVLRRLETMGKPSIAAVNGFALGGGCELAMACSIRIASENAKFGQPEVNLGVIPGYAGTQRLSRIVGKGVAMELTLTGRIIDAREALMIGLVSQVVPHDELAGAAKAIADTLKQKGPLALQAVMDVIDRGFDMPFDDACRLEAVGFASLCGTQDMKEGTTALLEKRKPDFKGK